MKRITGAVAAALLVTSALAAPAMAQTSPSVATARAGAEAEGASELRGGFLIPALAVIAIILGILAAVGGGDDGPTSP